MSERVAALLYHHVGPLVEPACRGLTVSPEAFAHQISALAGMGHTTITPAEWAGQVRDGRAIPKSSLMITFDDAYADLVEHAFPILEKHGFSATVFVATALIGGRIPCNPRAPDATIATMSETAIKHWHSRGIVFGAHSRTHTDLCTLTDDGSIDEILGSQADLSTLLQSEVGSFAYPYGKSSPRMRQIVAERFETAFSIEEGMNDPRTPLAELRRSMVQHGDTVMDVCLRARYGKSILERVRTAVRASVPARTDRR